MAFALANVEMGSHGHGPSAACTVARMQCIQCTMEQAMATQNAVLRTCATKMLQCARGNAMKARADGCRQPRSCRCSVYLLLELGEGQSAIKQAFAADHVVSPLSTCFFCFNRWGLPPDLFLHIPHFLKTLINMGCGSSKEQVLINRKRLIADSLQLLFCLTFFMVVRTRLE